MASSGLKPELLNFSSGRALEKIASTTYIPEELDKIIRDIQAAPEKDSVYLYDRALGAGEVYGPNNNGDWFGKDELINHHDSFTKSAALYRHHQNKGPKIGDVVGSAYNKRLDTVDLIIKAPLSQVAADVKKLENGFALGTSMGARVEHDICSICGKKSRHRGEYCPHLKYNMLKMYEDGNQVFARNPKPRFIDISLVIIPADPSSAVLRKIAGLDGFNFHEKQSIKSEFDHRGPINRKLLKIAYEMMNPMDAVMTLDSIIGPLRPDEFSAIFNKNASLIMSGVTPCVTYKHVKMGQINGKVMNKFAYEIRDITTLEDGGETCYMSMSEPLREAYLKYRILTKTVPGPFII